MTELIWEGKYDKDGRKVGPLRVALPFQTVETANESVKDRQRTLDLFAGGRPSEWRNRLIWGDKKYVLPAVLAEFAGKVDLIYIDPPFATGQNFSFTVQIDGEEFVKEPSAIEVKAYRDTWGKGLDSYFQWTYETAVFLYELLSEKGSLYVHLDYRVVGPVRMILDSIFGVQNLINEIIWYYKTGGMPELLGFGRKHDNILFYVKNRDRATWNPQKEKSYLMHKYGFSNIEIYSDQGGQYTLVNSRDVFDIPALRGNQPETVSYPTQKPEALVERLVRASSNEGDLVMDCFVGSGTTAVVAERLKRRWIAADLSRFSTETTRKRLLAVPHVTPFVVQNLGKYERQLWQAAEFGEEALGKTLAYRRFILGLYKSKPIEGYAWLHGLKDGRMVHVATVDAPVTVGDVKQIAAEFQRVLGAGKNAPMTRAVDVLGWDFAFELNEVARQTAGRAGLDMRFWRIPREVLDKRAVEQGDVRFFELAALDVDIKQKAKEVVLRLRDFVIPADDVPQDVQQSVKDWSQWIDYWAIDWDHRGDAFHNEWQAFRTKAEPKLPKSAEHVYETAGNYQIVVKVIDILGNDTTKTLKVKVP